GDLDGPALAVFAGPHSLVRSDLYREPHRQVPTWNYVAAHATGVVRRLTDPAEVLAVALAEHLAGGEQPDPAYVERLSAGVVAFELQVSRWEGKVKLSQNRDAEDRLRVIDALVERGEHELVAWMRRFGG
ncbi:MAG: FMN-binding negative transcriptional regulator, partial [Myxococcota bacterium]